MGLETLIVILVILIIGILADGVRRMLKERNNRLHLRIDPKAKELAKQPYDDVNPELPSGGARPLPRSGTQKPPTPKPVPVTQRRQAPTPKVPPLVMEPEEEARPPVTDAVQVDLFQEPEVAAPSAQAPADKKPQPQPAVEPAASAEPPSQPAPAPRRPAPELLEVIVMHMVTPAANAMPGRDLLQALLEQGMRYGDMNIFHRHQARNGRDELQFSMANALEPGTFDIDNMETQSFRAVTFFLKMPGPANPGDALERMIKTIRHLGDRFGGEVRDDQHSALTQQTIEHMRERVRDFERRSRVAGV
ncbi:MAG: cell division protein ZipA [Alcanivoracaceae bacterium]|nr:cell division protein ZipA [Alcanivoracaceae bacterium]